MTRRAAAEAGPRAHARGDATSRPECNTRVAHCYHSRHAAPCQGAKPDGAEAAGGGARYRVRRVLRSNGPV
ncbi:hypothetical protein WS55_32610 [Burkholderia pseudomultivorans]|nr:hypothetical protein WS55_32610 [Burkholderia pseudomultivorans]